MSTRMQGCYRIVAGLAGLLLAWALLSGMASAQQVSPPSRVVIRADGTTRHTVYLSPGYNVFLVFDAPVEFVAVGDERLVSVYLRADDGIVGLKSAQQTGRTNLHVYAGGLLVAFELVVTRSVRTADVVVVSVRPSQASQGRVSGQAQQSTGTPSTGSNRHNSSVDRPAGETRQTPPNPPIARPLPTVQVLEDIPEPVTAEDSFQALEVVREGLRGVFQAYRTAKGLEIWYQVSNLSGEPLVVYPERVLVRLGGQVARWQTIRRRPASQDTRLLPHGGVEVGVIVLGQVSRSMELVFPVFQAQWGLRSRPILLEVKFDGLDQLPEVSRRD